MNLNRLKGVLTEKGKTYEDCAKALGISAVAFNSKMNGRTRFYVPELLELLEFLELTRDEKVRIFLD